MLIISPALLPKQDPRETWHEALTLDPASQSQLQVEQVGWWAQEPQLMTQVLDPLNLKASSHTKLPRMAQCERGASL